MARSSLKIQGFSGNIEHFFEIPLVACCRNTRNNISGIAMKK